MTHTADGRNLGCGALMGGSGAIFVNAPRSLGHAIGDNEWHRDKP